MFKTTLYGKHIELGAKMIDFHGWNMPIQYRDGIISEHLATRKKAGLFDISHMGRFIIRGNDIMPFLQKFLTNNAAYLDIMESQYTLIQNDSGGTIDDAYLYYFTEGEYILVVNASNREKDLDYFKKNSADFKNLEVIDSTFDLDMISLQGPDSKKILLDLMTSGKLPEPLRNKLSAIEIDGIKVLIGRTGYTGEPLCFELFIKNKDSGYIWDKLLSKGAIPVGLGARNTLRIEAGLPLYGAELGEDIPIFTTNLAKFAVSFALMKEDFVGRKSLFTQFAALKKIEKRNYSGIDILSRIIMPVELLEKGVAREGDRIFKDNNFIGYVTSGTIAPYWEKSGTGINTRLKDNYTIRSVCLALMDSNIYERDRIEIEIRGKRINAVVMPYLLRSEAPPYAYAITSSDILPVEAKICSEDIKSSLNIFIRKAVENNNWRQEECINLIPSEMTASKLVRMLSILDPAGRYAEHKKIKAFSDINVFYYQGTGFISEVESALSLELSKYLRCRNVETRVISGQMANSAVFGALVDFLNSTDKKSEPKRLQRVINHHIIKGGHLSAQPLGALKDFISIDPVTEKPAVTDFPVCDNNPYLIDLEKTKDIIIQYKPVLLIFGKSMVIHKEPVREIKDFILDQKLDCLIMYDMAHVLGLVGPYFQQPFKEGADIVTGSTHKTFFGTQRGLIASDFEETELKYKLWEMIENRAFPGSVSNHHPGTMLGLLAAAYEMNYFRDEYQKKVITNAKTFAAALKNCGFRVAGDPGCSFTETHQVIVEVGFGKGSEIASILEKNNIITNFQATSEEEGFTASGAIRLGVAEMTRFGMEEDDFKKLAEYMSEIIIKGKHMREEIKKFRRNFIKMRFCFEDEYMQEIINNLLK